MARGDTLQLFGGYLPDRNTDSPDHWTLVVGDSVWSAAAPLPVPRGHLAALLLDGDLYALSGNQGHNPVPADLPVVHRFDADSGSWSASVPLPFPFSHAEPATMVYEGNILMVGGRARTEGRENLDDLIWFHPELQRWIHHGNGVVGVAFGNPSRCLGVQADLRLYSTARRGLTDRMGLNLEVSRYLPGNLILSVGWENILTRGAPDTGESQYGVLIRWFVMRPADKWFSSIGVSVGLGNGR